MIWIKKIKTILEQNGWSLSTCESLTCGMLASKIGDVPGISKVYAGGLVTYQTIEKNKLANVSMDTLDRFGAIAEQTAREMCVGVQRATGSEVSISVTGNAGPNPDEGKPVGLVYIGTVVLDRIVVKEYHLNGDRQSIREQTCKCAFEQLLDLLISSENSI